MSRRYESEREREYEAEDRRRAYRRRERRAEERRIELASFAALMLVFMVDFLTGDSIPAVWLSLVGGGILLASAIYQTQRRWRVTPITWIGGAVMVGAAIISLYERIPLPGGVWLPIGVFAAMIIVSAITGEF